MKGNVEFLRCRNCRKATPLMHLHYLDDHKLRDYLCCRCVESSDLNAYFKEIIKRFGEHPLTMHGKRPVIHLHAPQYPQLSVQDDNPDKALFGPIKSLVVPLRLRAIDVVSINKAAKNEGVSTAQLIRNALYAFEYIKYPEVEL